MSDYNFEKFFDYSPDLLCIASPDGYFKRVNASFPRMLGWTSDELTSQPFFEFIHSDDIGTTEEELEKLVSGVPTQAFRNRYRCSDGTYRQLMWNAFPESDSGLIFASARDATELVEANQRFQLVIEASPVGMIMVDQRGIIQLVNMEIERLFEYSRGTLIGKTIEVLVPVDDIDQHQKQRDAFFQEPSPRPMGRGRHVRAVRRNGEVFPVEIGLNPIQFSDGGFVLCTIIDLTLQKQVEARRVQLAKELKEANTKLTKLAGTDKLTNVLNRRAFDEQLDRHIQLMRRMRRSISLLMIDVDNFKAYNDQYGHQAGDERLQVVSDLLRRSARVTDMVARYGGEEFGVILPNTEEAGAVQLTERIQRVFHSHPWKKEKLTISIGASTIRFDTLSDENMDDHRAQLIFEADQALYVSKDSGRDRATHFSRMKASD